MSNSDEFDINIKIIIHFTVNVSNIFCRLESIMKHIFCITKHSQQAQIPLIGLILWNRKIVLPHVSEKQLKRNSTDSIFVKDSLFVLYFCIVSLWIKDIIHFTDKKELFVSWTLSQHHGLTIQFGNLLRSCDKTFHR